MSTYKYKFVYNETVLESTGFNLFDGARNAGIAVYRADPLSKYYLQDAKFEDRVRDIWGIHSMFGVCGAVCFTVHQKFNSK